MTQKLHSQPLSPTSAYSIVLDIGTTGAKALIFNDRLELVSRSYRELHKFFPQRGWVEQDPQELLTTTITVLHEAVSDAKIPTSAISSIGITNQRETIIAWDAATGKPFYPAIVWEDTRTTTYCRLLRLRGKQRFVRERTGLPIDTYFSASKIRWLLAHVPAAKAALHADSLRVGTVDSWIIWHLTSTHEFKTDYTNASRTLLFNLKTLGWDEDLLKLFGIPAKILPQVLPSTADFGTVTSTILPGDIPIRAVCGDQQASMYAAGVTPHTTKITYGTGAFLMQITGMAPELHTDFFTTVVPSQHNSVVYAVEAKVGECGSRITPALGHPEQIKKVFTAIAAEVARYTKKLPYPATALIADGGGIRSPELGQIQAATSGIPVHEQAIFDGTALGVAKLLTR